MQFKSYDRIKRYIKRHPVYWLSESSHKRPKIQDSKDFIAPRGLPSRLDFAREFNWAKEQSVAEMQYNQGAD